MSKPLVRFAVISALTMGSTSALALPFNSFDPRSMAMGGVGVAVADPAMAAFFNPALLAVAKEEDDFAMNIPIAGIRAYDPGNLRDKGESLSDNIDAFNRAKDNYNISQNALDLGNVSTSINAVNGDLAAIDNNPVQIETGAAFSIAIPSRKLGTSLFVNARGAAEGIVHYKDKQLLDDFSVVLGQIGACNNDPVCLAALSSDPLVQNYATIDPVTSNVQVTFNPDAQLQSSVDARAAALGEAGLALATEIGEGSGSWAIGLTPKYVKVRLYDVNASYQTMQATTFEENNYKAEYTDKNFDIGIAKNYANGWRSGFVIKNVLPKSYDYMNVQRDPITGDFIVGGSLVPTGNTLEVKPQARLGVSHQNSWSTVALDVDLTSNPPVGMESKSRYVAIGGELDLKLLQLRLGYRQNLEDKERNVASAGVGIYLFGLHVDAAVAGNSNEVGASVQAGFEF